jgi:hypothetical protein
MHGGWHFNDSPLSGGYFKIVVDENSELTGAVNYRKYTSRGSSESDGYFQRKLEGKTILWFIQVCGLV